MNEFEHERLDVYKAAIELLVLADAVAATLPRGRGYLADQLRRAASSISFNIAEGAGEFASDEKARFYRMARRSAIESAAIFDACRVLSLTTEPSVTGWSRAPPPNRRDAHSDGEEVGLGLGLALDLNRSEPLWRGPSASSPANQSANPP